MASNVELPKLRPIAASPSSIVIDIDPAAGWGEACGRLDGGGHYRIIRPRSPVGRSVEIALTGGASPVFRYRYPDGAEFLIGPRGRHVLARTAPRQVLEDTLTYLLGPVMALVVRLNGALCLHGSAVAIDRRAIGFVGGAGAGKSTLAAAFALEGTPVVTDDLLVLSAHDGRWLARPGFPYVRLWPDGGALPGLAGDLPRLTPNWDKRYLDLLAAPCRFQENSLPLERIYLLERDDTIRTPDIEEVDGARAMLALIGHMRGSLALMAEDRGRELVELGALIRSVPVRRLLVSEGPDAVAAACERVRRDVRGASPMREAVAG